MRVAIIGAGIIGASLAHALSKRGAEVTVLDAAGPAAGATGASFGWINASFFADAAHFALRFEGIEAWRRLTRELALPVAWSGCLCWEEEGEALEAQARGLRDMGYAAQIVNRSDFASREPAVAAPEAAVFFEDEAAADPVGVTQALLATSGAPRIMGVTVQEVLHVNGRVTGVRLPGGVIPCDRVVVAGGTGAPRLLEPLGVALPMLERPGVIFKTKPLPPLLSHICAAPIGEFRQLADGRILMPTAASHQGDSTQCIADSPIVLADAAAARLQALLPGVSVDWEEVSLAYRPVTQDGLPVVGACGPAGLYTAVMHSGVTLAPVVAEILSAQVIDDGLSNHQANLVAPYAPDRLQSGFSKNTSASTTSGGSGW